MPSGTSDSPITNKTEFQRFVDQRPEAVELFSRRLVEFRKQPRHHNRFFGAWMRSKHLGEFTDAYHGWWQAKPELFILVYENTPQDLLSSK